MSYRASTFIPVTSPAIWERALGHLPNPHALQSWAWGEFKSRWGWQMMPHLLTVAENKAEPLAAAMVLKRPLPRTPYCILYAPKGPLFDYTDRNLRQTVLAELEKLAKRERAIFIKVDPEIAHRYGGLDGTEERLSPTGMQTLRTLQERGWQFSDDQIQFRNTVEINVQATDDELLSAMKSKTRYNIRLAGRKGITVRQGTPADYPMLADMYAQTAERDGFTIRPLDYYLDAWQSFHQAGMGQALIAEYETQPIAAVYLVRYGNRVLYMYGASTNEERNRMPTYLLQWEAIVWAREQGCQIYDFWGAPNEFVEEDSMWGVWRFKRGFAGQVMYHLGAWDYTPRPLLYWAYTRIIPKYLEFLRSKQ